MSKLLNFAPVPIAKEILGSEILLVEGLNKHNPSIVLRRRKLFIFNSLTNRHIKCDSYVYSFGNKTNLESQVSYPL